MQVTTVPRIGFFIPSGVGLGYTGPGVFLKRLLEPLDGQIVARVYAGTRPGLAPDPALLPDRSIDVGASGPLRQLLWALVATAWIVVDQRKLDAVHFHGTYLYKILPAFACILLRIPYVLVPLAAGADFSLNGKSSRVPGVKRLLRFIARKAAGGFALGEDVADELLRGGVNADHVHTIMNPVSPPFFALARADRFDLQTILFVGSMGPRKRPVQLLETLRDIRAEGVNARGIFLGPFIDGAYEERFLATCMATGMSDYVEHVPFTDDVARFMLEDASVFVLLSETEGIPGALVEAMASGLPCVVSDAGAMRDIVAGSGAGSVVDGVGSDPVAEIIHYLRDADAWSRASANAHRHAIENFTAASIAEIYLKQLTAAALGATKR